MFAQHCPIQPAPPSFWREYVSFWVSASAKDLCGSQICCLEGEWRDLSPCAESLFDVGDNCNWGRGYHVDRKCSWMQERRENALYAPLFQLFWQLPKEKYIFFFSFLLCFFSLGEEKQVKKRVWKEGESVKWLNEATSYTIVLEKPLW